MEKLINKYKRLLRANQGTNEGLAYKMIVISLENYKTIGEVRENIQAYVDDCTDQDRRGIYKQFLEETKG